MMTVVMKNWEPFVSFPAFAIPVSIRRPSRCEGQRFQRTEEAFLAVLQLEVLIGELVSIDGLAASTIALGKVSTLDHEVFDDTVKC